MNVRRLTTAILAAAASVAATTRFTRADVAVLWDSTGNTWSSASHWSGGIVPNNDTANGTLYDVTVNGGNVALDISPTIQQLAFGGGTISGTGTLTIANLTTWGGGATFAGSVAIVTKDLNITLFNNHAFMTGNSSLTSTGNTTWTSNGGFQVGMNAGNSYTNAGNFTINTTGGANFTGGTFNNSGNLTKISGDATPIGSLFNNTGSVSIGNGTLTLSAGGTHTGTFTESGAGLIVFSGGTHNFNSGASIANGTFNFTGGTSNFNAGSAYTNAAINLSGGALNLNSGGTHTIGAFNVTSGTLGGSDTLSVGNMTWSGGATLGGSANITTTNLTITLFNNHVFMSGNSTLTSTGNTTWTSNGGFQVGMNAGNVINNAGNFTINTSGGANFTGGTFNNSGNLTKISGDTNPIGALFNNSGAVSVSNGTLNFSNGGTHTGSFSTTGTGVIGFTGGTHNFNTGAAASGSIAFGGGTSNFNSGSSYNAGAGSTAVTGGTVNFAANATLTSLGTLLSINGGNLNLNSGTHPSVPVFNASSGTLGGSDDLSVTSNMTWTGGTTLGGSGNITTKDLTITLFNNHVFMSGTRTLTSTGNTTWTSNSGFQVGMNAGNSYTNAGNFTINTSGGANFTGGTFNNSGNLTKISGDTNPIGSLFNNSGSVSVSNGTLNFGNGGTHTGSFSTSGNGTIGFTGGTHNFNAGSSVTSASMNFGSGTDNFNSGSTYNAGGGTTTVSGATVNFVAGANLVSLGTTLNITGGTLNLNSGDSPSVTNFNANGGALGGSDNLAVTNNMTWSGGNTLGGSGNITTKDLTITLFNNHVFMSGTRSLTVTGNTTWTSNGGFQIGMNSGNSITNLGDFTLNTTGSPTIQGGAFNNAGTFTKISTDANSFATTFNNTGTFAIDAGSLSLSSNVTNMSTVGAVTTLTGGTWDISNATLQITSGNNITTNDASVSLIGPGASFTRFTTALITNNGDVHFLAGSSFTAPGPFTNNGPFELGGGSLGAPSFTNNANGSLFGFGNVNVRPTSSGIIRATGGTLALTNGVAGTGTLQVDPGGTLDLSGSAGNSFAGSLVHNGNTPASLVLGLTNLHIAQSYTNASFGAGNAFNKHANVSATTGKILADGDNTQNLVGAITGGNTTTPAFNFGNVHVGSHPDLSFQILNAGASTGPAVLYALQTASITDPRLIGTGVTASNVGPVAYQASSPTLDITFNATSDGPLTAQTLHIANNFDNISEQNLTLTGTVYNLASVLLSGNPVNFGNHHVGDVVAPLALSVTNAAPNDGFSEKLDGGLAFINGNILISGSFSLLAPQATDTSILFTLNTSSAGSQSGSAIFVPTSNGAGTSGLGLTSLSNIGLSATGNIFRLAAPVVTGSPINFGNHHVGDSVSQSFSLQNSATNDGFSEKLDASITSPTGANIISGSVSALAPGASSTAISAALDTSSAGNKSGAATLLLTSNGAGTSNLGLTSLSNVSLSATGAVYRLASPLVTGSLINFGNHHVGDVVSQSVSIQNNLPADGFSEKLDASLSNITGANLFSGSISLLAPGASSTSISASLDTSFAGPRTGSATLSLTSNGSGTSGLASTLLSNIPLSATGTVYGFAQPARVTSINLGIIHVGDSGQRSVPISNTAPTGFFESLDASFGATTGPVTTSGGPVTLAPQASSNLMKITLDTSSAGLAKTGSAALVFVSDGTGSSGLGNTSLSGSNVSISADVLNFADVAFHKDSGSGTLTTTGSSLTLDFGTVNSPAQAAASLSLLNDAIGPADTLAGSWSISAPDFLLANFNSFSNISAGNSLANLQITLNSNLTGLHTGTITLHPLSQNAAPSSTPLSDITLTVSATINPAGVPEPATLALLALAAPFLLKRRVKFHTAS